jgi:hypothetical protein
MCSLVLFQASQLLLDAFVIVIVMCQQCRFHLLVTAAIAVFTVDADTPFPFLSLSLPSTAWQEQLPNQDGMLDGT